MTTEERDARWAREHEEWKNSKATGAIKVGKDRYFWIAYRFGRWLSGDQDWPDSEGFASTLDEALAMARQAADAIPGPLMENPKGYQGTIRRRYQKAHARKPKPSTETDARPDLGSLWETACRWDSGWTRWTITKITPRRVFVYRHRETTTRGGGVTIMAFESDTQRSFDRATLERDGSTFCENGTGSSRFYTDKGKAEYEADRVTLNGAAFPLLGIPRTATRAEVLAAFRNLAKTAHPDAGGDAAAFRELVAEKDRALRAL